MQKESDYRQARDAGKGGVAGTGMGAGNEFVLINASTSGASATTPTGTSGSTASGTAFEITGSNEGRLADHVGKRVEIRGKIKAADTTAAGKPTGGATAGMGQDLKLGELEVTSVKEVPGTCPAK